MLLSFSCPKRPTSPASLSTCPSFLSVHVFPHPFSRLPGLKYVLSHGTTSSLHTNHFLVPFLRYLGMASESLLSSMIFPLMSGNLFSLFSHLHSFPHVLSRESHHYPVFLSKVRVKQSSLTIFPLRYPPPSSPSSTSFPFPNPFLLRALVTP